MRKDELEFRYQLWRKSKGFLWRLLNRLFPKWFNGPTIIQRLNHFRDNALYQSFGNQQEIDITQMLGVFADLKSCHTTLFELNSAGLDQLFGPWLYQNELTTDHLGEPFSPLRIRPAQLIVLDGYAFHREELHRMWQSHNPQNFAQLGIFNNPHTERAFSHRAKYEIKTQLDLHFNIDVDMGETQLNVRPLPPPAPQAQARAPRMSSFALTEGELSLYQAWVALLSDSSEQNNSDEEEDNTDYEDESETKQREEKYRNAKTFMYEDVEDIAPENLLVLDRYAFDKTELTTYFDSNLSHLFKNPHPNERGRAQNFTDAAIAQLRSTPEFQRFFKAYDAQLAKQNDAIPREFISQLTTLLNVYLAQTPRDATFALRNFNDNNPAERQALDTCHQAKANFNAYILSLDASTQKAINNYVITIYFRHSNANVSERFQSINDGSKTGGCVITEQRFLWRMLKTLNPEVTIPKALKRHPDVNLYDLERNGPLSDAELASQSFGLQRLMADEEEQEDATQSTRLHWRQHNPQLNEARVQPVSLFFLRRSDSANAGGDTIQPTTHSLLLLELVRDLIADMNQVPDDSHNHPHSPRSPGRNT